MFGLDGVEKALRDELREAACGACLLVRVHEGRDGRGVVDEREAAEGVRHLYAKRARD